MTAGLCVPAHCPDRHCSRVRDPGRRRKGEESESAPRETLAQGAFQLCRLQWRSARTTEAQPRGRRTRPHLPEPRSSPLCPGSPRFRVGTVGAPWRAAITKTPRSPRTEGYLEGGALQPRPPDGSVGPWWPTPSRVERAGRARSGGSESWSQGDRSRGAARRPDPSAPVSVGPPAQAASPGRPRWSLTHGV